VARPPEPLHDVADEREEDPPVGRVAVDVLADRPAGDDVVEPTGDLDPRRTCHGPRMD
jgi:hypothetical protein